MSDLVKHFGEKLREKNAKRLVIRKRDFAAYVGIERGNYGKMERGNVNIKLETLYKLVNALNCEFEEILPARQKYKIDLD